MSKRIHLCLKPLNLVGHSHVLVCQFTAKDSQFCNGVAHGHKAYLFGDAAKAGFPMNRRRWKRQQPNSLRHALELCKEYAREMRNLSVERIAERMGVADHWTLYKWISSGRMPAVMIPAYEAACGISYVTQWMGAAAGKLLIDIPTGRKANTHELNSLQGELTAAMTALLAFHDGKQDAESTLAALRTAMEGLGWHHGNVAQHAQPQLELGGNDE